MNSHYIRLQGSPVADDEKIDFSLNMNVGTPGLREQLSAIEQALLAIQKIQKIYSLIPARACSTVALLGFAIGLYFMVSRLMADQKSNAEEFASTYLEEKGPNGEKISCADRYPVCGQNKNDVSTVAYICKTLQAKNCPREAADIVFVVLISIAAFCVLVGTLSLFYQKNKPASLNALLDSSNTKLKASAILLKAVLDKHEIATTLSYPEMINQLKAKKSELQKEIGQSVEIIDISQEQANNAKRLSPQVSL
jgi:hypothetical protein